MNATELVTNDTPVASTPWARAGRFCAVFAVAASLAACATKVPAPTEQLANARASIAQAESAGATQLAPIELQSARAKLLQADTAARAENFARARSLADESQADAVVAERKARAAKAEAIAAELVRSNQQLSNEAQRNAKP